MSHFDTSWQSIVQAQRRQQKLAVNETPSQDHVRRQTEDIRTVTIPLHQALRPDMMHHYHTIRAMFAGAQDVATNMKSELCTLARMTLLKVILTPTCCRPVPLDRVHLQHVSANVLAI